MNKKYTIFLILISLLSLIACKKDKVEIPEALPELSLSAKEKKFGNVEVNTSIKHEFTISNKGGGKLIVNSYNLIGDNKDEFEITANDKITLSKNETATIEVKFTPKSIGDKNATIILDSNIGKHSIALSGNGFKKDYNNTIQDAWIYFKDKPKSASFLSVPTKMLSQRALNRRKTQGIALDMKDVPIENSYINKIKSTKDITIFAKSKWLNAIHVQAKITTINELTEKYSFISKVEYADRSLNTKNKAAQVSTELNFRYKFESVQTDFTYGTTSTQVEMLKVDYLHKQGYTGKGVVIAVIDAGFPNVNTLDGFKRIRDNKQILGGYDFVKRNNNFYTGDSHGTHVLSTIAGYIKTEESNFVGTAPDASFYLFRTEDADKEVPLEESLWVEAAERADSLGVDIINTSLGYDTYDNPKYNHTYADLDGKTAFMTRGAEIAASRGMIVVNAAGNEGNKDWKYIDVPADAKSVLTVGAVTSAKAVANFSSRGPTADNRIKPDVMALGFLAIVIHYEKGFPSVTNGTSFSSPIMAGAIASLRQAYPKKKATEIVEEVKKGGNSYKTPDNNHGYGIPNFETIYQNLKK